MAGPPGGQSGRQDQRDQAQRPAVCGGRDVCGNAGPEASVAKRGERVGWGKDTGYSRGFHLSWICVYQAPCCSLLRLAVPSSSLRKVDPHFLIRLQLNQSCF